jgi:hypothetical protein
VAGGIYDAAGCTTTLENTIVAENLVFSTPQGTNLDLGGPTTISPTSADNLIGVDPMFDSNGLQNNGGPTPTIALELGSPAIDAGSTALAVDPATGQPLTYDQRGPGFLRVLGSSVDIGAYEAPVPLTPANVQSALASLPAGGTLTVQADPTQVSTDVSALNTVAAPSVPVTTVLELGGGTYSALNVAPPPNLALVLDSSSGATLQGTTVNGGSVTVEANVAPVDWTVNGGNVVIEGSTHTKDFTVNGGTVTFVKGTDTGNSPALVVNGGTVFLQEMTAQTATNAPTIVLNAGSLTIRQSQVLSTGGFGQPAILVNGGSLDLGSSASPGGDTIQVPSTDAPLVQASLGATASSAGDTFVVNGTTLPAQALSFTSVTSSAPLSLVNQPVALTATISPSAGTTGRPTGGVDFVDSATGADLGSAPLSGGVATLTTTALGLGNHVVRARYTGDNVFAYSLASCTQTVIPSVLVLDPKASGALSLLGNASLNVPSAVVVDSSSASAISASGNVRLVASSVGVVGGVRLSGGAMVSPVPSLGVATVPDPLAGLPTPISGASRGSVNLTNGALTLNPGLYARISVSGNASLTLNPGVYIIAGGGFTVTGNAGVNGSGVMIDNAGSDFPAASGSFGGLTLSGNGRIHLTPFASAPYTGLLIVQPSANTRALALSGNGALGLSGTIYAPGAQLFESGSVQLGGQVSVIVGTLNLSGNASLSQIAQGSDGTADGTTGIADTLLAGDLAVYVDNASGAFTSDELARVHDAITSVDSLLAPYSVTVMEVTDPALANVVLTAGTTSPSGGPEDGVLGCYDGSSSTITMLQGWNWYAGADPSQVGADRYDFQTVITHELGHALGLGGSADNASPMNETLPAGTARRTMAVADLNIPLDDGGPDPERAAPVAVRGSVVPAGPRAFLPTTPTPVLAAPAVDVIVSEVLAKPAHHRPHHRAVPHLHRTSAGRRPQQTAGSAVATIVPRSRITGPALHQALDHG